MRNDTKIGKLLTILLIILPIAIVILIVLLINKHFFTPYSEKESYYESEPEEVEVVPPKSNTNCLVITRPNPVPSIDL